jgi:hypothetical protein
VVAGAFELTGAGQGGFGDEVGQVAGGDHAMASVIEEFLSAGDFDQRLIQSEQWHSEPSLRVQED